MTWQTKLTGLTALTGLGLTGAGFFMQKNYRENKAALHCDYINLETVFAELSANVSIDCNLTHHTLDFYIELVNTTLPNGPQLVEQVNQDLIAYKEIGDKALTIGIATLWGVLALVALYQYLKACLQNPLAATPNPNLFTAMNMHRRFIFSMGTVLTSSTGAVMAYLSSEMDSAFENNRDGVACYFLNLETQTQCANSSIICNLTLHSLDYFIDLVNKTCSNGAIFDDVTNDLIKYLDNTELYQKIGFGLLGIGGLLLAICLVVKMPANNPVNNEIDLERDLPRNDRYHRFSRNG